MLLKPLNFVKSKKLINNSRLSPLSDSLKRLWTTLGTQQLGLDWLGVGRAAERQTLQTPLPPCRSAPACGKYWIFLKAFQALT